MPEKTTSAKPKAFTEQFDTVIAFLSLEMIALAAFGIGGMTGIKILDILGFFVAALTIPFLRLNYSKADAKANLKWLIPLGVLFVLLGFSGFYFRYYGGFNLTGIVYSLVEVLGLVGFFLMGLGMRSVPVIKKEYILYALLGGLALYCVITGIYGLARYGFFYGARFHGLYYYYKGVLFPVYSEGKALYGFKFLEASLNYGCVPSLLLGCSGVGLIGLSPKQNQRKFVLLASFSGIGLLYSLLIPFYPTLIAMAFCFLVAGIYHLTQRFIKDNPGRAKGVDIATKVVFFGLIAIALTVALLLLLENKTGWIQKVLTSMIHRVPKTVATGIAAVGDALYNGEPDLHRLNILSTLFGYMPSGDTISLHATRFFLVNIIYQNGVIAFFLILFFTFFFMAKIRRFLREGDGDLPYRLSLAMMILGLFGYINLFADDLPFVHNEDFLPMIQTNYMLVLVFLLGLAYMPEKAKKEVPVNE